MSTSGLVHRISLSELKGDKKKNVPKATLLNDYGFEGDAHGGSARQVSLLPFESFDKVRNVVMDIAPGDFAENITTTGLDFTLAAIGRRLTIGDSIRLEITQIGKECHHGCYIREAVGDCIMPREGVFAKVLEGGEINVGQSIRWESLEI